MERKAAVILALLAWVPASGLGACPDQESSPGSKSLHHACPLVCLEGFHQENRNVLLRQPQFPLIREAARKQGLSLPAMFTASPAKRLYTRRQGETLQTCGWIPLQWVEASPVVQAPAPRQEPVKAPTVTATPTLAIQVSDNIAPYFQQHLNLRHWRIVQNPVRDGVLLRASLQNRVLRISMEKMGKTV